MSSPNTETVAVVLGRFNRLDHGAFDLTRATRNGNTDPAILSMVVGLIGQHLCDTLPDLQLSARFIGIR